MEPDKKNKNNIEINIENDSNNNAENVNIDDLELKDLSFDLKPDSTNAGSNTNISTSTEIQGDKNINSDASGSISDNSNSNIQADDSEVSNALDNTQLTDSSLEDGANNISDSSVSDSDMIDVSENYDDRSLKEKVNDLKDNINQTKEDLKNAKEKIQNLPEDIKNKKDEVQRKGQKAKENIQNLPENARKKAQDIKDNARRVKENIQNIPRNKEELASAVKDRLKKSAQRAKEKAQDAANKAVDRGKKNLKDRIQNSKPARAVKNAKRNIQRIKKTAKIAKKAAKATVKVAKAAVKAASKLLQLIIETSPWSEIIIVVVVVIIILIMVIAALKPGVVDINLPGGSDQFSETDLKTLNKLRSLYEKYPNADAALAMVTVVYPYYDTLQSGDMKLYIDITDKDWDPSKTYQDYEDISSYEDDGETEDTEEVDEEVINEDDMYLELFRKWSYRRKFKLLLKKSNTMTEDEFIQYLKDDYFQSESGYKYLYSFVDDENKEAFTNEIIDDLKNNKSYFLNYIYSVVMCTNSSTSLGFSYAGDIIQGEPVVVLKDSSSGDFETIKASATLYGTDDLTLDLKRYVMGVAYAEIGEGVKKEALAKAVMITAKSFVLGRTGSGHNDSGVVGMGFKTDQQDGKTIFYLRGSTADQDFCDVYEGCKSGSKYAKDLQNNQYNSETKKNTKSALDQDSINNLSIWYDEVANEFIYDSEYEQFAGNQYNDYGSSCKIGSCLSQKKASDLADQGKDYKDILYGSQGAFTEDRYETFDMETSTLSKESSVCEGISVNGSCGIPDDNFVYYNQMDYNDQFCGRTDGSTISSSGCGVTSMAMVIANLTDQTNITPVNTMNEAYSYGYCGENIRGTAAGYFKVAADNYGLTYQALSVDNQGIEDAKMILQSGGLIIANVGPLSPFTTGGHYVVIRKIDGEGNVYVADPAHSNLYKNSYPINDFVNQGWITNGWWGFTSSKSQEIVENYCKTVAEAGEATGTFIRPIENNSACNDYPTYSGGSWHGGGDIPTPVGTPVLAADGGIVDTVKYLNYSYGHYVIIDHGNGYKSWYGHMSTIDVKKGDKVAQGQQIGKSGNTGKSTGPHLHFEVRKSPYKYGASHISNYLNPCDYIGTNKRYSS